MALHNFGLLLDKKLPPSLKKPDWQNFAQSGHTGPKLRSLFEMQILLTRAQVQVSSKIPVSLNPGHGIRWKAKICAESPSVRRDRNKYAVREVDRKNEKKTIFVSSDWFQLVSVAH